MPAGSRPGSKERESKGAPATMSGASQKKPADHCYIASTNGGPYTMRNMTGWAIALLGCTAATANVQPAPGDEAPPEPRPEWASTFYIAELSGEAGWEDVMFNPLLSKYVGAYLVAGTVSRKYAERREGALDLEFEGQVVYNFGSQSHWEFNAVPIIARWKRFPWSSRIKTSAAFGIGLSYATELPPVEVALEGESRQTLIYWVAELTAGPVDAPWAVSARLHHRSVGYGLFAKDGGMNAVGLGVRYAF